MFSTRAHFKNCPFCSPSSSVLMLHEQVPPSLTYPPAASLARQFPTSVHIHEQREEEGRQLMHLMKDDRTSQATLDSRLIDAASPRKEESYADGPDEYKSNSRVQLIQSRGLWYLFPLDTLPSFPSNAENFEAENVLAMAKKALSASREASRLAEHSKLIGTNIDSSLSLSMFPSLIDIPQEEEKTVRSIRLLERRSRKRRVPKPKVMDQETICSEKIDLQRKITAAFDLNDPVRLFVGPETKLLTVKEESDLIGRIQDLMKLEIVKNRLQSQFGREPTFVEWGKAVGLSSRALQSQLYTGNRSREKLIHANYRMVVHIARQYQGHGLSLVDLLQEGSRGLMRSIEKFKPQAGCRVATYAYWWIRQAIRKAIFRHSRTIRLPDNVYGLLSKVKEAKKLCIQQGRHQPTKGEIASCAGITVEKLEKLLFTARMPLSMQQPVWTDQHTTFQEVTADMAIEAPDLSVAKQLMRLHIRKLVSTLDPKERKIIRLRFGIEDGKQKSLAEIGTAFGLSKERVRQLESRAIYKLKQFLSSQGLKAYADLLL